MTNKPILRSLNRDEIIEVIAAAVPRAVRSYERISGMAPRQVPEAWIGAEMAESLHRMGGFYVIPEVPLKTMSTEMGFSLDSGGKLDLAVYDPNPFPDEAELRCIIEVKGAKSQSAPFKSDCDRIRHILDRAGGKIEFGLFVYASGELLISQFEGEVQQMTSQSGVAESEMKKIGPYGPLRTDLPNRWWFGLIVPIVC